MNSPPCARRRWLTTMSGNTKVRGRPKGAKNKKPTKSSVAVRHRLPAKKPTDLVYSALRNKITAQLQELGLLCQEKARRSPAYQPPAKHEYRSAQGARVIVWWENPGQPGEYVREVWTNLWSTQQKLFRIFSEEIPVKVCI